jgi:hypothetical protein
MNTRKDDYQISLFGLSKCHFEFSRDEIEGMRGFKCNFERLLDTDFIKHRMDRTPVVFAGEIKQVIPAPIWSEFIEHFRHFILQKDPYNYNRVRGIAFKHPRRGPTKIIRRQMDRAIDNQRKFADDAFKNGGMLDFKTATGETVSAFSMWEKYVYTYNFHVDYSEHRNKNIPVLKAFDFNPENPNTRAHLASCLVIKMAAFARVYDHICDILHFIENPNAPESAYRHRSRPYSTESYLKDEEIDYTPIKDLRGVCLLGEKESGPYESIGLVALTLIARGIEIQEYRYFRGFHALSDIDREVSSAEAHIRILTDDGIASAARLLCNVRDFVVQGEEFVFRAEMLGNRGKLENGEMRLELDVAKITIALVRSGQAAGEPALP